MNSRLQKLEEEFLASGGEWKRTILKDWFTINTSVSFDKGNIELSNNSNGNDYEFIGRTSINNGIQGYVKHLGFEPNNGNTFSVIQVGENIAQFRKHKWYGSQNLFLLTPKFDWIISHYKYIIACINSGLKIFDKNYSSYPTMNTLNNLVIFLPIRNEQPDISYMHHFISELQAERLQELQGYLKVTGLSNYTLTDEELHLIDRFDSIEWMSFDITNVFNVNNTHSILSSWITPNSGGIPYVTAGESNNSISTYIDYDISQIEKGNSIMIGGKTLVITYQESDYFSNDSHNLALYAKDEQGKLKDNQFFMISSLYKSLKPRYSWGDSISKKKIQLDTFDLPVKNGLIDYEFMSKWIQIIKKLVIADVVKYADRELSAYQSVIV